MGVWVVGYGAMCVWLGVVKVKVCAIVDVRVGGCACVVWKCGCGGLAWRREHVGVGVDNVGVNVGVTGDVNVGELCGGGVSA